MSFAKWLFIQELNSANINHTCYNTMRISEIFGLGKTQPELDFVDIDVTQDTPLFLDPFFLSIRQDNWSLESTRTIKSFFQRVVELIRENKVSEGKVLFRHLQEPNSTCLGMSVGEPSGRGVGAGDTDDIFESILKSKAVQTGLIEDLEDNILFVDGFGKDKLSDMTTNIIRRHLIEYTISQCVLHNIPMVPNLPSGYYWNRRRLQWEQEMIDALVVNERKILLVPKGVVSFFKDYTPSKYYNHFVLNFLQNEHLQLSSALVRERKNGTRYVTKKDLKERHPFSKEFLAEFTQRNPDVLKSFKEETKISSLTNSEIGDTDIRQLIEYLIRQLQSIPSGNADATRYHRMITGILELLFYPYLIYPDLEQEIHSGRKRIDIKFDNAATEGIFFRLSNNMGLPCQYVMVECKNYSSDPSNPELDQLSGRFSPNRGKVGLLLCRTIDKMELFIDRCRDTFRDDRGLIIPLIDVDIIEMLEGYRNHNTNNIDIFMSNRIRQIAIN
jgi:hypothetical protein